MYKLLNRTDFINMENIREDLEYYIKNIILMGLS